MLKRMKSFGQRLVLVDSAVQLLCFTVKIATPSPTAQVMFNMRLGIDRAVGISFHIPQRSNIFTFLIENILIFN